MSKEVLNILRLTKDLSPEHQWQLLQALMDQLKQDSLSPQNQGDIINELSHDQKNRLAQAIEQSEKQTFVSHQEVQESVKKWLTK